jgi:hypothetical protein
MNPNHPALKALHLRSTLAEVEAAMKAAGCASYDYAKDKHFEQYVLKDIKTVAQARAFVDMLKADRYAMEGSREYDCQKTWGLKNLYRYAKKYPFLGMAGLLSSARRTHCSCHEVGSFALNRRYHEAIAEQEKKEKEKRSKEIRKLLK